MLLFFAPCPFYCCLTSPVPIDACIRSFFFVLFSISQEYTDTFLAQGKPVFNVEYNLGMSVCDSSNKMGLDTIVKVSQAPFHLIYR